MNVARKNHNTVQHNNVICLIVVGPPHNDDEEDPLDEIERIRLSGSDLC